MLQTSLEKLTSEILLIPRITLQRLDAQHKSSVKRECGKLCKLGSKLAELAGSFSSFHPPFLPHYEIAGLKCVSSNPRSHKKLERSTSKSYFGKQSI